MSDVTGVVPPSADDGGEWEPAVFGPVGCVCFVALTVASGAFWRGVVWLVWGV